MFLGLMMTHGSSLCECDGSKRSILRCGGMICKRVRIAPKAFTFFEMRLRSLPESGTLARQLSWRMRSEMPNTEFTLTNQCKDWDFCTVRGREDLFNSTTRRLEACEVRACRSVISAAVATS